MSQNASNGANALKWILMQVGTNGGYSVYIIKNVLDSKCIDVPKGNDASGQRLAC